MYGLLASHINIISLAQLERKSILCVFVATKQLSRPTCFWQFSISLKVPGFIWIVSENDISLGILVIPQANEDDVTLIDPHL